MHSVPLRVLFLAQLRCLPSSAHVAPATQGQPVASGGQPVVTECWGYQEWKHTDGCKTCDDAWNGQPPVRCKLPPQERFTQRGQETRCDRSAHPPAGSHTNSWLLEKAIGTAYSFAFPGEALDYAPSTPDYEWVRFFWGAYMKPPTDHWLSSRNPKS